MNVSYHSKLLYDYFWEVRQNLGMHFYQVVLLFFNALARLIVMKSNGDKYQMFKCFKTQWCFCFVLQTFDNKVP